MSKFDVGYVYKGDLNHPETVEADNPGDAVIAANNAWDCEPGDTGDEELYHVRPHVPQVEVRAYPGGRIEWAAATNVLDSTT